jgi:hypothetical protein
MKKVFIVSCGESALYNDIYYYPLNAFIEQWIYRESYAFIERAMHLFSYVLI